MREVVAEFRNPVMLYSIGKDSSVMLHLARKAFAPAKLPFPVLVDPDPDRAVYRHYGLDKVWITLQRSGTFLIDKQGIVRYIHQVTNPQASVEKDELMGEVEKLQTPK